MMGLARVLAGLGLYGMLVLVVVLFGRSSLTLAAFTVTTRNPLAFATASTSFNSTSTSGRLGSSGRPMTLAYILRRFQVDGSIVSPFFTAEEQTYIQDNVKKVSL
jgi:hypothetical protein